jgi:hypothetical protein
MRAVAYLEVSTQRGVRSVRDENLAPQMALSSPLRWFGAQQGRGLVGVAKYVRDWKARGWLEPWERGRQAAPCLSLPCLPRSIHGSIRHRARRLTRRRRGYTNNYRSCTRNDVAGYVQRDYWGRAGRERIYIVLYGGVTPGRRGGLALGAIKAEGGTSTNTEHVVGSCLVTGVVVVRVARALFGRDCVSCQLFMCLTHACVLWLRRGMTLRWMTSNVDKGPCLAANS